MLKRKTKKATVKPAPQWDEPEAKHAFRNEGFSFMSDKFLFAHIIGKFVKAEGRRPF